MPQHPNAVAKIRVAPEEVDLQENWMQIMRWAARRFGHDSVQDVTEEELAQTVAAWRAGERPSDG